MQMEMFMKEIGRMTKQKVMGCIPIWMVQSMKDFGRMTNSMEKERKLGLIMQSMREIM